MDSAFGCALQSNCITDWRRIIADSVLVFLVLNQLLDIAKQIDLAWDERRKSEAMSALTEMPCNFPSHNVSAFSTGCADTRRAIRAMRHTNTLGGSRVLTVTPQGSVGLIGALGCALRCGEDGVRRQYER